MGKKSKYRKIGEKSNPSSRTTEKMPDLFSTDESLEIAASPKICCASTSRVPPSKSESKSVSTINIPKSEKGVPALPKWFTAGVNAIKECRDVEQFRAVYSEHIVPTMKLLQQARGEENPEEWALLWAIRMRTGGSPEDWAMNWRRKLCLELVYKLYDFAARLNPDNDLLTTLNQGVDLTKLSPELDLTKLRQDTVIQIVFQTFGLEKLDNILQCSLYMDRAQALYVMRYPGLSEAGMHWVSQQHVDSSSEWKKLLKDPGRRPTINKRLVSIAKLMEPHGDGWITKIMKPCSVSNVIPVSVIISGQKLAEALMTSVRYGYLLDTNLDSKSKIICVSMDIGLGSPTLTFHDALKRTTAMVNYLEATGVKHLQRMMRVPEDAKAGNSVPCPTLPKTLDNPQETLYQSLATLQPKQQQVGLAKDEIYFDVDLWEASVSYMNALAPWLKLETSGLTLPLVAAQSDAHMICCMVDRLLRTKTVKAPSLKMTFSTWVLTTILFLQMVVMVLVIAHLAYGQGRTVA